MIKIDLETWDRKEIFNTFNNYSNPCFSFDLRLDVTDLYINRKKYGGFFIPFTYILSKALNETKGPKYRIIHDEVYLFEDVYPSFTVEVDDNNFCFCRSQFIESYKEFYKTMKGSINKTIDNAKNGHLDQSNVGYSENAIYISCLKWLDQYSMTNPYNLYDKTNTSIPRVNWGKVVEKGNRYEMGISFSFHHGFIDGYEFAKIIKRIEEMLNNVNEYLEVIE